jgi:hypothetical protein
MVFQSEGRLGGKERGREEEDRGKQRKRVKGRKEKGCERESAEGKG